MSSKQFQDGGQHRRWKCGAVRSYIRSCVLPWSDRRAVLCPQLWSDCCLWGELCYTVSQKHKTLDAILKPFQRTCYTFLSGHNLKWNETKSNAIIISLQKTDLSAATYLTRVESLIVLGITSNTEFLFWATYFVHCAISCKMSLRPSEPTDLLGSLHVGCHSSDIDYKSIYAAPAWRDSLVSQTRTAFSQLLNKPSATATYQVILKMYILLWNVWNLHYLTVQLPSCSVWAITSWIIKKNKNWL